MAERGVYTGRGMIPYLHILGLSVPTFGLMLWLAAVAGAIVLDRSFKRAKIDADAVGMVAVAVLAGIIGAKLWHVLDSFDEFRELGLACPVGSGWICMVRRADLRPGRAGLSGLAGRIGGLKDPGSGGPGGSNWLRRWANWLFPLRRRLLWIAHESSLGNELSERIRADTTRGARSSNTAVRIWNGPADRLVALGARQEDPAHWLDLWGVSGPERDSALSG